MVDDIIYVEVTGSLSKWDTHFFSVDIQSPGIKKVVLRLKDTGNSISLPPERKHTLEEEVLEEVEEASSKLQAAHAALWKAYEGTIGIQDTFMRVMDASTRLDAICNKLSLLKDANESLKLVKTEDVNVKPDPTIKDTMSLWFEHTSTSLCCVLPRYCGNTNSAQASLMKPWAYHIIPFDPIDIPTQLAKRKGLTDMSTGPIHKHAKLEMS
ncbi:hypothetical protein PISMIDRAFT_13142 [Pisolithus microcarpus 441]|uniref:Uncharacterized protein n=1 Tax=Pisolithus microcarpus 441 TaxID=765257 RepID=A0A0C9ZJY3_9AGAM|nr:hypothetical protein PISMIDRAFT_13142 [Pisolithus microcarpus 441]